MDFLLGTALIIPGPHQLPLTIGVAALKVGGTVAGAAPEQSIVGPLQPSFTTSSVQCHSAIARVS